MSWTDERVELLKKMWAEGQSASQIAKELGSVTRNAVIGKVHRLGLSNRVGGGDAPKGKGTEDEVDTAEVEAPRAEPVRAAPQAAAPRPEPRPQPRAAEAAPVTNVTPMRKAIIPAGQPLPPQPSAGEISPEAYQRGRDPCAAGPEWRRQDHADLDHLRAGGADGRHRARGRATTSAPTGARRAS
jgi:GcrA cell cycle regulator